MHVDPASLVVAALCSPPDNVYNLATHREEKEREKMIKKEIVRALLMARNPSIPLVQPEIDQILRQARAHEGMFDEPAYRDPALEPQRPESDMGEHKPETELPAAVSPEKDVT